MHHRWFQLPPAHCDAIHYSGGKTQNWTINNVA
ncbi:hypothetical protein [Limnobaculum parvum]